MKRFWKILIAFAVILIVISIFNKLQEEKVDLGQFYEDVGQGIVESVSLDEVSGILAYKVDGGGRTLYVTKVSRFFYESNKDLLDELLASGVTITFKESMKLGGLFNALFTIALIGFLVIIFKGIILDFGKTELEYVKDIETRFDDLAGYDNIKEELSDVIEYLKNPEKVLAYTDNIPKGILLEGDPGNGKTLLGRVIAGESNTPFFHISGSDIEGKFVSQGASRVGVIFKKLKEVVEIEGKAILFIDELDAIGVDRESRSVVETSQTLNKILTEMDGFESRGNILVLGATNLASSLDAALVRPGRFDRVIRINPPEREDRRAILDFYLGRKGLEIKSKCIEELDYINILAEMTDGFSGASLERLVEDASLLAFKDSEKIGIRHLREGYLRNVMGLPVDRALSREEKKIIAYHEAGHAIISMLHSEKGYKSFVYGTIKEYGQALGHVAVVDMGNNLHKKSDYEKKVKVLLAGRAVEDIILEGDFTDGASNDLLRVNHILEKYLMTSGMSEQKPNRYISRENHKYSDERLQEELDMMIYRLYKEVKGEIISNLEEVEKLGNYLIEYGEIDSDKIKEMFSERYAVRGD